MYNNTDKEELRDNLFSKYFEVEEGVNATELVDKLSFIPEVWDKLNVICENNIEYFDKYSSIEDIKLLKNNDKNYLILKIHLYRYVIIDVERKENVTEEQFRNNFDENFFVNNFNSRKRRNNDSLELYDIEKYEGNIGELLDFYLENEHVLNLSKRIHYVIKLDYSWTYFHIDFVNASSQLAFETRDQFLYEQLYLRYDLTPSRMQDTQNKIGIEKMEEIFQNIKEIKIPQKVIPSDLYKEYLIRSNEEDKHKTYIKS